MAGDKSLDIRTWFGFRRTPFASDLNVKDIFIRPSIVEITDRIRFAVQNAFYYAVIGEVGSGKSTAMRYALGQLPPKQYSVITISAGNRSFNELLRQVSDAIGAKNRAFQATSVLTTIYECYRNLRESGVSPVIFIDEAHLIPMETMSQLHLLSQQNLNDTKVTPIVMCGQDGLFETLRSPFCKPVMSRVLDGYNLRSMAADECSSYIRHQMNNIAGAGPDIFDDLAIKAIYQSSGGIPRKINAICLLSLDRAMRRKEQVVTADMIREVTGNWWER